MTPPAPPPPCSNQFTAMKCRVNTHIVQTFIHGFLQTLLPISLSLLGQFFLATIKDFLYSLTPVRGRFEWSLPHNAKYVRHAREGLPLKKNSKILILTFEYDYFLNEVSYG
jgi:hypothetical protein